MNQSKNKMYLIDHFKAVMVVLFLAILCGVCYKKGMERVQVDAIYLGYAEYKEGKFMFKSVRAIEFGGE